MRYPLLPVCLSFAFGIISVYFLPFPVPVFLSAAFLFLLAALILFNRPVLSGMILLVVFFLLGASACSSSNFLPGNHVSRLNYISEEISLKGIVVSEAVRGKKRMSFMLDSKEVAVRGKILKVSGFVLVRQYARTPLPYGSQVILRGKINWPYSFYGSGTSGKRRFDYRQYLRRRMVYSVFTVRKGPGVESGGFKGSRIKQLAFYLRGKAYSVFERCLSPSSAALYAAMLLGKRDNVPEEVNLLLMKMGTVHVLAVSGLHTAIVAFIMLLLLKLIRVPRRARFLVAILFLAFYCLLTGSNVPVARSVSVAVIMLFGCLIERRVNVYNSLALAAILLLSFNPNQLFDVSFQLSFGSVLSILLISRVLSSLLPNGFLEKCGAWVISALGVSFSAWIGTLGLTAYYFGIISFIAVIANVIIVPYISLIVAGGFLLLFSALLPDIIFSKIASSCELLMIVFVKMNWLLAKVPWAYVMVPELPLRVLFSYYAFILACVFIFQRYKAECHYTDGNI